MRSKSNGQGKWPLWQQLKSRDAEGLGEIASSPRAQSLAPRTATADKAVPSVCPYCGVGCGQLVYVKQGKIIDIEGDPRSPISHGCLCPKGAATFQLVTGSHREHHVLYRRPYGTRWETIPLEQAMDMVAQRVRATREANWQQDDGKGHETRRTMAIAHLGG